MHNSSHKLHPTENRDLAIPQLFANSLVDRKIAKLGGYRKISAKYAIFRTISGVGLLLSLHYNDLILMGNRNFIYPSRH